MGSTTRAGGARRTAAPPAGTALAESEADWMEWVAEVARAPWAGWTVAHFRPSVVGRSRTGAVRYGTAVQYDAAGFPDLVLVHPERRLVLYRELKADAGNLRREQKHWAELLTRAGADYAVWTPSDRAAVTELLTDGRASTP